MLKKQGAILPLGFHLHHQRLQWGPSEGMIYCCLCLLEVLQKLKFVHFKVRQGNYAPVCN